MKRSTEFEPRILTRSATGSRWRMALAGSPLVLTLGCSKGGPGTATPADHSQCQGQGVSAVENLGLYTTSAVTNYFDQQTGTTGKLPPASGLDDGPLSLSLTLADNGQRLSPTLTIGNRVIAASGVKPVILDTGSAGVTVDCQVLFDADTCSGFSSSTLPSYESTQNVYVTDIEVTRCYGAGAQSGYLAVSNVILGSGDAAVSAPMPFVVVTQYPNDPPAGAGLVGINSSVGGGLVSPMIYFDTSAAPEPLDTGFTLTGGSSPTLTVGLSSSVVDTFTTSPLTAVANPPSTMPSHVSALLWSPYVPATIDVFNSGGSMSGEVSVLFDTGTQPQGGNVNFGQAGPDCSSDACSLTVSFAEGSSSVNVLQESAATLGTSDSRQSIIGLDFLLSNSLSTQFMLDFSTGQAGFALSGQ
ncbi:MAG: hypothetical protein AAF799_16935 [Myxococcota bacterium]